MTAEHRTPADQAAARPRATDKHGREIVPGDHVEIVHFGEHHVMRVDEIDEHHGLHLLCGRVVARVPAAGARKLPGPPKTEGAAGKTPSGGPPARRT